MKRIYIASPYSLGDKPANVRRQIDAYSELMDAGYCAYAPLLSHYIDLLHPRSYVEWMAHDLRWIDVCDAVFRQETLNKGESTMKLEVTVPFSPR